VTTAQQATEADRRSTSLFAAIRGVLVTPVAWFSNLSDEGAGRAVRIAILVQLVAGPIAEIESGLLGVGHPEPVRAALGGPLLTLMRIYLAATIV